MIFKKSKLNTNNIYCENLSIYVLIDKILIRVKIVKDHKSSFHL